MNSCLEYYFSREPFTWSGFNKLLILNSPLVYAKGFSGVHGQGCIQRFQEQQQPHVLYLAGDMAFDMHRTAHMELNVKHNKAGNSARWRSRK